MADTENEREEKAQEELWWDRKTGKISQNFIHERKKSENTSTPLIFFLPQ